jgi:hypothetical protein
MVVQAVVVVVAVVDLRIMIRHGQAQLALLIIQWDITRPRIVDGHTQAVVVLEEMETRVKFIDQVVVGVLEQLYCIFNILKPIIN